MLFVSFACFGQTTEPSSLGSRIFVGINAAPNLSWLTGPEQPPYTVSATPGLGYRLGGTVIYGISPHVSLEFSPGYVFEKNSRYAVRQVSDGSPAPGYMDVKYKFSWLEMPLLMNYSIMSKGSLTWYAGAGISVRYRTYSKAEGTTMLGSGLMVNGTVDGDGNDWLFSPVIQTGAKFALSPQSRLDLKISYQRSITPLYNGLDASPGFDYQVATKPDEIRLNNLCINVVYTVRMK